MRILMSVDFDTSKANELVKSGQMGETINQILAGLKPEAAYAHPLNGHRAMTIVVDAPDGASLVGLGEPFWLELGAHVEAVPCMNADELAEGISRIG